jgi:hypothetical protein
VFALPLEQSLIVCEPDVCTGKALCQPRMPGTNQKQNEHWQLVVEKTGGQLRGLAVQITITAEFRLNIPDEASRQHDSVDSPTIKPKYRGLRSAKL